MGYDITPISKLVDNVSRLLSELKTLRQELLVVKEENEELKSAIKNKEDIIKDFQKSNKITNIVGSIDSGGNDADELRLRIDENIQELEECIARLSK